MPRIAVCIRNSKSDVNFPAMDLLDSRREERRREHQTLELGVRNRKFWMIDERVRVLGPGCDGEYCGGVGAVVVEKVFVVVVEEASEEAEDD